MDSSSPARKALDLIELEGKIVDIEGDVLLLDLAVEEVIQSGNDAREYLRNLPEGYRILLLTDEQIRCLTHASGRVMGSAQALSRTFYGPSND